jgi:hypothetical protein
MKPNTEMEENYENITKTVIAERLSRRGSAFSRNSIYSASKQGPNVEAKKSSFMLQVGKSKKEESASPSLKKGGMCTQHQAEGNRSQFVNFGTLKTNSYSERRVIRGVRKYSRTEKNSRDSSDDSSAQKSNGSFGKKATRTMVMTKSHSDLSSFNIWGMLREGINDIPVSPLQSHDNQSMVHKKLGTEISLSSCHEMTLSSLNKLSGGIQMNSRDDVDTNMMVPQFSKTSFNEEVLSILNNPSMHKTPSIPIVKKNTSYALQAASNKMQGTKNSNPKSHASHYTVEEMKSISGDFSLTPRKRNSFYAGRRPIGPDLITQTTVPIQRAESRSEMN